MDKWQHELESSIHWDQGDVLIVDVGTHTRLSTLQGTQTDVSPAELCRPARPLGLGGRSEDPG